MSVRKAVVLLSGGVDSVTALYDTCRTQDVVAALSFDYDSKHNARELPLAAWHAHHLGIPHVIIPLAFFGKHFRSALLNSGEAIPSGKYNEDNIQKTVVPFRNGVMLSIAAGFAESQDADAIVIGAHGGDHAIYPDCRPNFMEAMAEAIRLGTHAQIEVLRPFIAANKADIVRRGIVLGVDYAKTWSCYVGDELHCGNCSTCLERREAFVQAGVPDPTAYRF